MIHPNRQFALCTVVEHSSAWPAHRWRWPEPHEQCREHDFCQHVPRGPRSVETRGCCRRPRAYRPPRAQALQPASMTRSSLSHQPNYVACIDDAIAKAEPRLQRLAAEQTGRVVWLHCGVDIGARGLTALPSGNASPVPRFLQPGWRRPASCIAAFSRSGQKCRRCAPSPLNLNGTCAPCEVRYTPPSILRVGARGCRRQLSKDASLYCRARRGSWGPAYPNRRPVCNEPGRLELLPRYED